VDKVVYRAPRPEGPRVTRGGRQRPPCAEGRSVELANDETEENAEGKGGEGGKSGPPLGDRLAINCVL
jgi:hypothetical protein